MTTTFVIVFCVALGLALYGFLGYPLLMWIASRLRQQPDFPISQPSVNIIVAAYNEQDSIAATLKSLLAQRYPREKVTISVFSDGSTDKTDAIVSTFFSQGVELVRYEGRLGKTECQNRMVERADARVVAFADGNVRWRPGALAALVAPLDSVAATTGTLRLFRGDTLESRDEGLFRRLDHVIKKGESALLSTVGVNGPIYAVKKSEFIKLRPHLVSDLVLPVLLAARGRRVVFVSEAIADEPSTPSVWHEFRRKRRLVTQGFAALPLLMRAVQPIKRPLLFFLFVSHKLLRWVGIELLLIAFIATLVLVTEPVFQIILILELCLVALAGLGLVFKLRSRLLDALSFFVLTNVASLLGALDYLRGETATRWRTERL